MLVNRRFYYSFKPTILVINFFFLDFWFLWYKFHKYIPHTSNNELEKEKFTELIRADISNSEFTKWIFYFILKLNFYSTFYHKTFIRFFFYIFSLIKKKEFGPVICQTIFIFIYNCCMLCYNLSFYFEYDM